MATLQEIGEYLDATLNTAAIPDYPNALNGIQLENDTDIRAVAAAVDFSTSTVAGAIDAGAQLLLVHHGMFWPGVQPITGHRFQRLRALIGSGLAVYSAHLPLDLHPEFGNNPLLAKRLGLVPSGGFAKFQGITVGVCGTCELPTRELAARALQLAREFGGTIVATPYPSDHVTRRWGICTGAGADSATLREAFDGGVDTLIVGEGPHHSAVEAGDLGIVVLYAGHYATETLGVRALADATASRFGIRSHFVDVPTGL
jgi:dinuclear metal center YbgI/SA1388 family protein